jgi:hypothetical protein
MNLKTKIKQIEETAQRRSRHFFKSLSYADACRIRDESVNLPGFTDWLLSEHDLFDAENYRNEYLKEDYLNKKINEYQKQN